MDEEILIKYYKTKCLIFEKKIEQFCSTAGISNSLSNALYYKSNQGISKFWYELYLAPKMYLANSRTFLAYREGLDTDFADEIISSEEIFKFQQETIKSVKLNNILASSITDYVGYTR